MGNITSAPPFRQSPPAGQTFRKDKVRRGQNQPIIQISWKHLTSDGKGKLKSNGNNTYGKNQSFNSCDPNRYSTLQRYLTAAIILNMFCLKGHRASNDMQMVPQRIYLAYLQDKDSISFALGRAPRSTPRSSYWKGGSRHSLTPQVHTDSVRRGCRS